MSHPSSSEPVTKDQKNGFKMGDHERKKSRISKFTNIETRLYTCLEMTYITEFKITSCVTTQTDGERKVVSQFSSCALAFQGLPGYDGRPGPPGDTGPPGDPVSNHECSADS